MMANLMIALTVYFIFTLIIGCLFFKNLILFICNNTMIFILNYTKIKKVYLSLVVVFCCLLIVIDFPSVYCAFAKDGVVYSSNMLPSDNQVVFIGVLTYTKDINLFFVGPYHDTFELVKFYQYLLHQEHYPLVVFTKEKEFLSFVDKLLKDHVLCIIHYNHSEFGEVWKFVGQPRKGNQFPFLIDFYTNIKNR